MIVVVGDPCDAVVARLLQTLQAAGAGHALVDERRPRRYRITAEAGVWRVRGGACDGTRAVSAVAVRHGVAAATPALLPALRSFRRRIDTMLLHAGCAVVNRPHLAHDNASKPYQLSRLAAGGFDIPRTLVTNVPHDALRFIAGLRGRVLFKGIGNVKTDPQVVQQRHVDGIERLLRRPIQFQQLIDGDDIRVTVVADAAFAARIGADGPEWSGPAHELLPAALVDRCIAYTRNEGLVVAGIDGRVDAAGRFVVFESNPFPLWTWHESATAPITEHVVGHLMENGKTCGDLFA